MNQQTAEAGIDYYPCQYGGSSLRFRGPAASVEGAYTAVIGGSETFGRFVEDPFADQLAERTGLQVLNLGIMNGGLDVFVHDSALMDVVGGAEAVVIQVMGANNLSNRFYRVHPRRNDRFLRQSNAMASLFPKVDFSDFAFTRHLLTALRDGHPDKFAMVEQELRAAWTARMRSILTRIPGRKILLWIENQNSAGLGPEPLFVTADMMQMVEDQVDVTVHCDVSAEVGPAHMDGMIYAPMERTAAAQMLTPAAHERVADALVRVMKKTEDMAA
ncbi:MAG: DUF6473 family protein [Pseudomonadota bacterium]